MLAARLTNFVPAARHGPAVRAVASNSAAAANNSSGQAPKARSQTSYQLFAKELYANKQVSGLTVAEASKKISAAWKALNVSEKSKFADKAASLKAEHEQTYGKPQKKAKAASGKKPNAFATFVKENFQDHKGPGDSAPAVMKRLSAKWKQLSAVEKTRYNPQPQH